MELKFIYIMHACVFWLQRKFSFWNAFMIHTSIIWICLMSPRGKNFDVGHNTLSSKICSYLFITVQQNLFIPAMLIGTIDFYCFMRLTLTLSLPAGHKVSTKQNLLASFSPTFFIWSGWNIIWYGDSSWTISDYVFSKIYWNKGNNCCFTDCIKKYLMLACIQMFMNGFNSNLVCWYILLYSTLWYWSNWPWPWFKVTGVQESQLSHKVFNWFSISFLQ